MAQPLFFISVFGMPIDDLFASRFLNKLET